MSDPEARKQAETELDRLGVPRDWPGLSKARAHGLAEDHDDHTEGISALGIAFTDVAGDLHAVSIPVPIPRFEQQKANVTTALLRLRADLPRVLGS